MATRRSTQPGFLQTWTIRVSQWTHGAVARFAGRTIVGAAFVVAIGIGLRRLEHWTNTAAAGPATEVRIQWAEVPDWLRQQENQHIIDDLVACSGLTGRESLSDPAIAA